MKHEMTECPNCGFEFDVNEGRKQPEEACPICKKMVENKLSHLRIDHDIKNTEDYALAMKTAKQEQSRA